MCLSYVRLSNFCISCLTVRTTLISHLTMCAYSPNIFLQNTKLHLRTHTLVLIHSQSSLYDTHTGQQLQHGTIQPPNGGSKWWTTSSSKGTSPKSSFQGGDANYMQYQQGFPPPPGDPQGPWGPQGLPPQGGNFFGDQFFRGRGGPPLRRGHGLGMRGRGRGFGFGSWRGRGNYLFALLHVKILLYLMSSHERKGCLI